MVAAPGLVEQEAEAGRGVEWLTGVWAPRAVAGVSPAGGGRPTFAPLPPGAPRLRQGGLSWWDLGMGGLAHD